VTYIPLAFQPDNTALAQSQDTGFATSRHRGGAPDAGPTFRHIKAYWVMMTPRMAQIALRSAPTISTARLGSRIYHDAGATTQQGPARTELLH